MALFTPTRRKYVLQAQFLVNVDPDNPRWREPFDPAKLYFLADGLSAEQFPVVYFDPQVIVGALRFSADARTPDIMTTIQKFGHDPDRAQQGCFHEQFPGERLERPIHAFCGPKEPTRLGNIVGHRGGISVTWHHRPDGFLDSWFLTVLPRQMCGVPIFRV